MTKIEEAIELLEQILVVEDDPKGWMKELLTLLKQLPKETNIWFAIDYLKKALNRWEIDGRYWVRQALKELEKQPCKTCGGSGEVDKLVPMPEEFLGKFHNASTDPCDMLYGPCACGAWHHLKDWSDKVKKKAEKRKIPCLKCKGTGIEPDCPPDAGEFTKAIRVFVKGEEKCPPFGKDSRSALVHLKQACDRLDSQAKEGKHWRDGYMRLRSKLDRQAEEIKRLEEEIIKLKTQMRPNELEQEILDATSHKRLKEHGIEYKD